ncbi:DedA family protein [Aeromonas simiae]|uniref:DedA family protein n=1 Tax=Aeromonas simiae TaxID=218936 RepID=A0A5J6WZ86_9GAMM|nr:VTT domain-containing protein [Aeromonas simiae]QFI55198.1 DedA family protein [Aeromonas simiae]
MQEMLLAIWQQDYALLSQTGTIGLLIACLVVILFLESSFVFLPLPGDSLVLLAGGLVGLGVLGPEVTLLYLPLAAGLGSLVAYWQGRALAETRFMYHIERLIPERQLERAGAMLAQHGFLAMFSSRFVPFVRVLTPMLMGISRLHLPRVAVVSFASAFLWSLALSLVSKGMMQVPLLAEYHHLLAKGLLLTSLSLFVLAVIAIGLRLYRRRRRMVCDD